MKQIYRMSLSFVSVAVVLTACSSRTPIPATVQKEPSALPASTPSPATLPPTPKDTAAPIPTETMLPPATTLPATLPATLYFLFAWPGSIPDSSFGVYMLAPGSSSLERITPPDELVSSFDVWPGDGRYAYGTQDGRIVVEHPGRIPSLYDIPGSTDLSLNIVSTKWSPDGSNLAYSVAYSNWFEDEDLSQEAIQYSGVFVVNIQSGRVVKLSSQGGVSEPPGFAGRYILWRPLWSPDGRAIELRVSGWETSSLAWLYPIDFNTGASTLHFPRLGATTATWSRDSRFLYVSDCEYCLEVDRNLLKVDRANENAQVIIDGENTPIWVVSLEELETKTLLRASTDESLWDTVQIPPDPGRYFIISSASNFSMLQPVGPDNLYNVHIALPRYEGDYVLLAGRDWVHLASLENEADIDLTPYFSSPLPPKEIDQGYWGP